MLQEDVGVGLVDVLRHLLVDARALGRVVGVDRLQEQIVASLVAEARPVQGQATHVAAHQPHVVGPRVVGAELTPGDHVVGTQSGFLDVQVLLDLLARHVERHAPRFVEQIGDAGLDHGGTGPLEFHVDLAIGAVLGELAAVLGGQRDGGVRVIGFLLHVGVVVRALRGEHLVGETVLAQSEQLVVLLSRRGQRESLAGTNVVEGSLRRVDHDEALLGGVVEGVDDRRILAQRDELSGVGGLHAFQLAVEQQLHAGVGIGDGVELDGVEPHGSVPVVLVAHEFGDRVLATAVVLERSGANRLLVQRRVGQGRVHPRGRRDVTELSGDGVREEHVRLEQVVLHREIVDALDGSGLGVVRLDGQTHEGVGALQLEGLDEGIGGEVGAIVELDAFADLDGPGLEVGRRRERLGQIGNGIALGVDGGQGVEHHVGHEETRSRQGRRGRVQSVDVGLDSVTKRATGNGVAFGFGGRCFGGGALVAGATIGCLGVARAAAVIVATTGNGEDHEARKRRAEDTPRAQFA